MCACICGFSRPGPCVHVYIHVAGVFLHLRACVVRLHVFITVWKQIELYYTGPIRRRYAGPGPGSVARARGGAQNLLKIKERVKRHWSINDLKRKKRLFCVK